MREVYEQTIQVVRDLERGAQELDNQALLQALAEHRKQLEKLFEAALLRERAIALLMRALITEHIWRGRRAPPDPEVVSRASEMLAALACSYANEAIIELPHHKGAVHTVMDNTSMRALAAQILTKHENEILRNPAVR